MRRWACVRRWAGWVGLLSMRRLPARWRAAARRWARLGDDTEGFAGFMAGSIPRVEAARSAATRGGGLAELSGRQCDDERADDDLKTGGTAEWAELGVLCMVPGADRAAHDFGFGGFVLAMAFTVSPRARG